MKKIGLNHSCTCKSGRKFKDCCLKRDYIEVFSEQGFNYFDEKYALKFVREHALFNNFYDNERGKIKKELLWFKKIDLRSAMSYGEQNFNGRNVYFIVGKTSPIPVDDAIHVAHEMQHLILLENGYKTVCFKEGYGTETNLLCKVINDMLLDPIVNSRLKDYGFKLLDYYAMADEIQERTIGRRLISNLGHEQIAFITTLYVKKTLDMRNIYPEINDEEVEFNKWIIKNYVEVVTTSKTILGIINEIGYDSPEKTQTIFLRVIDLLGLNDVLMIN